MPISIPFRDYKPTSESESQPTKLPIGSFLRNTVCCVPGLVSCVHKVARAATISARLFYACQRSKLFIFIQLLKPGFAAAVSLTHPLSPLSSHFTHKSLARPTCGDNDVLCPATSHTNRQQHLGDSPLYPGGTISNVFIAIVILQATEATHMTQYHRHINLGSSSK